MSAADNRISSLSRLLNQIPGEAGRFELRDESATLDRQRAIVGNRSDGRTAGPEIGGDIPADTADDRHGETEAQRPVVRRCLEVRRIPIGNPQ